MNKNYLIVFLIILVVAGGSFFAGVKYQESKIPSRNFAGGQLGNQFRQRNGANGQAVRGQILDTSSDSVTVKLPDGSSKIILVSDKTTISKAATGSKSDLKNGETVAVFGTSNSDGSVTAENIQLNPQTRVGQPK